MRITPLTGWVEMAGFAYCADPIVSLAGTGDGSPIAPI
jgi:hypothetical protein